jgi:hypothetical protein
MQNSPTPDDTSKIKFDLTGLRLDLVAFYGSTLSEYTIFFWHK